MTFKNVLFIKISRKGTDKLEWEKLFATYTTNKGLTSRIQKN